MATEDRSLMALSRHECVDLLRQAQVGRVVFTERAMPAVVPVSFAMHDDAVVMHTSSDSRLAAAAHRGVLAFEADDIDPASRTGWSVVVVGEPRLVSDPQELARIRLLLQPWAPGHLDVCLRLPLSVVTGRRIVTAAVAAAAAR
jgi:nitroimidazol reductase NimA-like FMN-containing flavoprotein (pyridoxamine 5'-phosphate oxidase superfamily)